MYPNPIPLNNGAEAINYDYRGPSGPEASIYKGPISSGNVDSQPSLKIAHQHTGSGMNLTRRTVVRLDTPCFDNDDTTIRGNIDVHLVLSFPERIADSDAVGAELQKMKNFLATSGFITKLIAGEI